MMTTVMLIWIEWHEKSITMQHRVLLRLGMKFRVSVEVGRSFLWPAGGSGIIVVETGMSQSWARLGLCLMFAKRMHNLSGQT